MSTETWMPAFQLRFFTLKTQVCVVEPSSTGSGPKKSVTR